MPRPSLKNKRREEILFAYEKAIALHGVDGASLSKVAEIAGIARPLLRHHVGNSDELLEQTVDRFIERSQSIMDKMYQDEKIGATSESFIDYLFNHIASESETTHIMVANSLLTASQCHPIVKDKMYFWFTDFHQNFFNFLEKKHPNATKKHLEEVTIGIISLYFNLDLLSPIGALQLFQKNSYRSATALLRLLS